MASLCVGAIQYGTCMWTGRQRFGPVCGIRLLPAQTVRCDLAAGTSLLLDEHQGKVFQPVCAYASHLRDSGPVVRQTDCVRCDVAAP